MRELICTYVTECDNDIRLVYRLYRDGRGKDTYYSLEIIEKRGMEACDRIFLEDVSREEKKALSLAGFFAGESVTPCTALYILDEMLPI